ncbi:MAG: hypothetical protein KF788_08815 [Piscinibacter sp.]|nr:hypothetical protein [Piscinibacter sp.]
MSVYRMPLARAPFRGSFEVFPKYRHLLHPLPWRMEKEDGRQWDHVHAEGGRVLVLIDGTVPDRVHAQLLAAGDCEVIAR